MNGISKRSGTLLACALCLLCLGTSACRPRTMTPSARAATPLGQDFERYFDSLLSAGAGVMCRDDSRRDFTMLRDLVLVRADALSWNLGKGGSDSIVWDEAYGAAIVREPSSGDEFVMLVSLYAVHRKDVPRDAWTAFSFPITGGTIVCATLPTVMEDRGLVLLGWDKFVGDESRWDSSGVDLEAWRTYLGFTPPFDHRKYVPPPDPDDLGHP